jgi:hypothetical protein
MSDDEEKWWFLFRYDQGLKLILQSDVIDNLLILALALIARFPKNAL